MNIYLEIFGYIGTALVIISMMMTSVTKLRIINICGSVISATYSVFCNTWPIVIMNICLIIINSIHLYKDFTRKIEFKHFKVNYDDQIVNHFINTYKDDIEKYFPNFELKIQKHSEIHMIYIKSEAVGILVGTKESDLIKIEMDYSIMKYRDIIIGKFLFKKLKDEGINTLTANKGSKLHNDYLKKIGFVENDDILVKEI